jgi:endonuclease-8
MPEGDTIHRTARSMQRALAGKRITRAESRAPRVSAERLEGAVIAKVAARGKHLLVHLEDGRVLRTHMQMTGSWHLYRATDRWRRPRRQMVLAIETDPWHAVAFNLPQAELLRAEAQSEQLRRLGPDLLGDDFDLGEAVSRLRAHGELPLGVAVMRQDLVSGIGNVYKSELLFLEKLDPFAPVSDVTDERLRALLERARKLMRRNLRGPERITTGRSDGLSKYVYGRQGEPCPVCETRLRMKRQGPGGRSTYWCPSCQSTSSDTRG